MMIFPSTNCCRLLSTCLLACIAALPLRAQVIILPDVSRLPDAIQNDVYPAPYTGKPYPFTFSLSDGSTPSSWDWVPIGGTADISTLDVDVRSSTGRLEYTTGNTRIQSGSAGTLCQGRVEARNNMGVLIAQRNYDLYVRNTPLPFCTAPKEYVFLLDRSGSMTTTVSGSNTRWDELKNTIMTYLPQLNDALTGQAVGLKVYYFNGGAASLKYSGTFGPDWSNRTLIEERLFQEGAPLADITPSGGTPMGDAICDAIQGSNVSANRTFILFTDGIQTVPPDYDFNGGTHAIDCTSGTDVDVDNSPDNQIKFFTIGTGGCDVALLQQLANPDNRFAQANAGGSPELNIFFSSTIPWSLFDCGSPRFIDYRAGEMGGGNDTISQKFKVNRLVDNLSVRLTTFGRFSYPNAYHGPIVSLYKDGVPVPYQPIVEASTIRYFIEFADPFEAGGEWELRFTGPEALPYELSVMAEDKYIKTQLSAGQNGLVYAGDPIQVKVSVTEGGGPVNNATVRAILLKPGEDLGDLAARTDVNANTLATQVTGDPVEIGQAKIDSLLQSKAFADQVRNDTSGNVLTLASAGNGAYTGTFTGNQLTGTYRVVTFIDGQSTGLGLYEGWETQCVLVDFSRPEDIDLQENIIDLGAKDGQHSYRIQIKPVNKFGKLFGPAQTRRIGIKVSQGSAQLPQDQLNGTYTSIIDVPEGSNPVVTITVIDRNKPVLKRPLNTITGGGSSVQHPFGLSLHLGAATPTGNFNTLFDPGIAVEGDLTYRLNRHFALEAIAGYYAFQPDFSIIGGTFGAMYSFPLGGSISAHLAAGLGAFQPENEDITFGYTLRAGLDKQLGTHLHACADLGFTGLPSTDYNFVKGTVGVKYFF